MAAGEELDGELRRRRRRSWEYACSASSHRCILSFVTFLCTSSHPTFGEFGFREIDGKFLLTPVEGIKGNTKRFHRKEEKKTEGVGWGRIPQRKLQKEVLAGKLSGVLNQKIR